MTFIDRSAATVRPQQAADNHTAPEQAVTFTHRPGTLMTAEDLAARWQVPKTHVYRLARDGRLPAVALGRYRRFRPDDIERWERAQTASLDIRPEAD